MENIKVSYEQIEKANNEIESIKLGTKGYAQVNERIKAFRKVYPSGSIETTIEEIKDDYIRIKAIVKDENNELISTGTASEQLTGDNKKDYINKTSMVENCETSAVGRALGFAGFGVDSSIASAEDIERNKNKSKVFEIYTNMFISEDEAKVILKTCINELCRKFGIKGGDLELEVQEKLWASLNELTPRQLQNIESKLKTVNMENDEWHHMYNQNTKLKDVTPVGQEVVYESSRYKFGKLALAQAGTDLLLQDEIKNHYLNMGIDLDK